MNRSCYFAVSSPPRHVSKASPSRRGGRYALEVGHTRWSQAGGSRTGNEKVGLLSSWRPDYAVAAVAAPLCRWVGDPPDDVVPDCDAALTATLDVTGPISGQAAKAACVGRSSSCT